jgi:hypothetical protein
VQDRPHFVGGKVDVGLSVVALHETVAVTVARYRSLKFGQQAGSGAAVVCGVLNGDLFVPEKLIE